MLDFIAFPLGQFLHLIYNTIGFKSYGLAIILFTLFVRLALLPLSIKQYKSMAKIQELQPLLQEIQKKYKNDKERLNQETLKVYQENKANPAGGCLPLLVQMPILLSLYWVIQKPLTYVLGMGNRVNELASQYGIDINAVGAQSNLEIEIITRDPSLLNLSFLGINLGHIPSLGHADVLWLIPILAALTTYFSTKVAAPQTQSASGNNPGADMTKSMSTIFPFMTGFFSFQVPTGLGLYWVVGNLLQIMQQFYMNKYIIKKKEVKKD